MLQPFQRKPMFYFGTRKGTCTFYEASEVSPDTLPHSRGSLSFPPQVKKSPVFPSLIRDVGRLPCFAWKGMQMSPLHPKGIRFAEK